MNLLDISDKLRMVSNSYGGVPRYLDAAGDLERARHDFMTESSTDNLARLNGMAARAWKLAQEVSPVLRDPRPEPELA